MCSSGLGDVGVLGEKVAGSKSCECHGSQGLGGGLSRHNTRPSRMSGLVLMDRPGIIKQS